MNKLEIPVSEEVRDAYHAKTYKGLGVEHCKWCKEGNLLYWVDFDGRLVLIHEAHLESTV